MYNSYVLLHFILLRVVLPLRIIKAGIEVPVHVIKKRLKWQFYSVYALINSRIA